MIQIPVRFMAVIILGTLVATTSMAKGQTPSRLRRHANVETQVAETKTGSKLGKWTLGKASHLQAKGLPVADVSTCEKFEIEVLQKNLIYKLSCGDHFTSALVPLTTDKHHQIERNADEITVTKINHYGQKIQTSRLEQSLIRIPFVEEVLHVKFLSDGTISFYREDFLVDDFGRVVQKSFIHGFGLSKNLMKIGRN